MNLFKRRLSCLVLFLIVISLLTIAETTGANEINFIFPKNNSVINESFNISVNLNFNTSNISFYYFEYNSSVSDLIGYNDTKNLSNYTIYWNISTLKDYKYLIKVNTSNASRIIYVYLDQAYPNISNYTFINYKNNKSLFNNNSFAELKINVSEDNITIKNITAKNSFSFANLIWDKNLSLWIANISLMSNQNKNNLTIKVTDIANKTFIKNIIFFLDLQNPNLNITNHPYDPSRGSYIGSRNDPATDSANILSFNFSDDINISNYKVFYDDLLIANFSNEQKYTYFSTTLTPVVGRHNITIIGNDSLNNTIVNSTNVYWWFGFVSDADLQNWENKTNLTNPQISKVYFASRSAGDPYSYSEMAAGTEDWCYTTETCGLIFNTTLNFSVEYLDISPTNHDIIDFNWNKSPQMTINNATNESRDTIKYIENNYTTSVVDLIIIKDNINTTPFIDNKSVYYMRVTLPKNFLSNYTDIFYFKNNDLSDLEIIYKNQTCPTINNFSKSSTTPCFKIIDNKTILYLPESGTISANLDNISAKINFGKSSFNNSIGIFINFSTSEKAYCSANITKNNNTIIFLTNSNLTSNNQFFYYNFSNKYFSNGLYNVTINCTDFNNNTNVSTFNFTVNDIEPPIISIISPESKTYSTTSSNTYNISIKIATNELSDIYFKIDYSAWTEIGKNSSSASYSIIKASGNYILTVYAEDQAGLSSTKNISFNVNAKIVEETPETTVTTTTSGIILQPLDNSTTISKVESQSWYKLKEGKKTELLIDNPFFDLTKISFIPEKNTTNLKISVKLIEENYPINFNNQFRKIYQYYKIEHNIDNFSNNNEFIFRIKKTWLEKNAIDKVFLSRHHDNHWIDLNTTKLGEDQVYITYKAISPGFSYFVINGQKILPKKEEPKIVETNINETIVKNETKKDISKPVKKKKINFLKILLFLLILISVSTTGYYSYKTIKIPVLKYKDLTNSEKEKLRRFISLKLSTGVSLYEIKSELINHGWSEDIVENIIKTVSVQKNKEKEIEEFVEKMIKLKNISLSDIKRALLDVGWQPEIIDKILQKYNK